MILLAAAGLFLLLSGNGLFPSGGADRDAGDDPDAYRLALERELSALCAEVDGVGRVTVMVTLSEGERVTYNGSRITSTRRPTVLGAAVVCDGGGNDRVRAEITAMLSSLLGIGSNRVTVSRRRP